jgi:pilus assembly protein CpaF
MTLSERTKPLQKAFSIDETYSLDNYRDEMREALFDQISSDTIARLLRSDIIKAEREVKGALRLIAKRSCFESLSPRQNERLQREVLDLVVGYGPLEPLLEDSEVTEIMVNGPRSVFFEKQGQISPANIVFSDVRQVELIIDRILGPLGRHVDEQSPLVSARLPQGYRVNVVIAPIALDGPVLTIRKFRDEITSLEELFDRGALDRSLVELLEWLVKIRFNIAVTGATGSGKTTFLNALSTCIPCGERVVTIEDAAELSFKSHAHVVRLEARGKSTEGTGEITIRDLVINALRMRPDRIIVGECRGAEALDMLQAMNTGHDGSLTTLHANSPHDAITRLEMMVRYGADLPIEMIERQIASALDLIIHLERDVHGERRVAEVDYVTSDEAGISLEMCCCWDQASQRYEWRKPSWLGRLTPHLKNQEEEVSRWASSLS